MRKLTELINQIADKSGLPNCPEGQAVVVLYARKLGEAATRDVIFFDGDSTKRQGFEEWLRSDFYSKAPADSEFTSKTFSRADYQRYRALKGKRLLEQMVELVPSLIRNTTEHHGESSGLYN